MKVGNDFIIHNFDKVVNNVRRLRGELNPTEHKTEGIFTKFAQSAKFLSFGFKDYVIVKPDQGSSQIKVTIEELTALLGISPDNIDNLTESLKGVGRAQISEKIAHQLDERLNQPAVVDVKTPPWDEMRQNLAVISTNKDDINQISITELSQTLNILEFHWDEIKKNKDDIEKYGQWDEERQVLHLRRDIDREPGRKWTLPRSVEIHFTQEGPQIYVLHKGSKHPERKKGLREKTEKLGKGGFKQVARSVNLNTLKEFVHATINIEKKSQKFNMPEQKIKDYSIREVQLQSLFSQDPEFVKIAGWSEYKKKNSNDTKIAITLEFCNAGELFKATERATYAGKRINENVKDLMQVVTDMLNMLVKLEQKGVINRDIKLENIFLVAEDNSPLRAKMSDFGLAWTQEDAKKQKDMAGSPSYAPPEYIDTSNPEEIRSGFSVHTWEMGITLGALLTGVMVYGREIPTEVGGITQKNIDRNLQHLLLDTETHLPDCIKKNRELRRFLKQMVNDMLQVNPLQRPPATELLGRLEDFKRTHLP